MSCEGTLKNKVRADIQCLRALAIFEVLGFHLWPQIFPLGYLGVDIFFVISGYLMTLILSRSAANGLTVTVLLDFYNRRAKRILPPYLLTIFGTIFICQLVLHPFDFLNLKEDAVWALGFATNVNTVVKKLGYFDKTHLYKFLLHTWSLGLEMQYYVIAPIVLRVISVSQRPFLLVNGISGISWTAQCFITDESVAFGFIGCRLWQFMVGTIAFYIEKGTDNAIEADAEAHKTKSHNIINLKNAAYTVISFLLIILVLMPFIDGNLVRNISIGTRLLVTILTGLVVAAGAEVSLLIPMPSLLSKTLVYVGDISYSVYLIHWPLIVLAQYLDYLNWTYVLPLVGTIFTLAIIQHSTFEKPLSKESGKVIYFCVFVLYINSFTILQIQNAITSSNTENFLKLQEQCKIEIENQGTCNKANFIWKRGERFVENACVYKGTGNLTVLMTGNSYAMRTYQTLLNFGKHKFKKLIVTAANTCVIPKKLTHDKLYCKDVADGLSSTLAEVNPDIVIINQRMVETHAFKYPLIDAETDCAIKAMRKDWAMISNYTKKIIIIEPLGGLSRDQDILKPLRLNRADLRMYDVPLEQYKAEVDPGWDRVIKSIDNCTKCKTIEIRSHFCDDKACAAYDSERRISLYCDVYHHSPTAVQRYIRSIVREIQI